MELWRGKAERDKLSDSYYSVFLPGCEHSNNVVSMSPSNSGAPLEADHGVGNSLISNGDNLITADGVIMYEMENLVVVNADVSLLVFLH